MSEAYQTIRAYAELHELVCKDYASTRGFDILGPGGKRIYTVFDGAWGTETLDTIDDGKWNFNQIRIRSRRNVESVKRSIRRLTCLLKEEAREKAYAEGLAVQQKLREEERSAENAFITRAMQLNQEFANLVDEELDLACRLSTVQSKLESNKRHWNDLIARTPKAAEKWKGRRDLGIAYN